MDKRQLREKLKIKRRYLGEILRKKWDEQIAETFSEGFAKFETFNIYRAFAGEAGTDLIIEELLRAGKKVYCPRVEGDDLRLSEYGNFQTGAFGIQEPQGEEYNGSVDVTVIPLLAVNQRGYRTGYGKGFYDRFLLGKDTLKVGLGYDFQIEEFEEEQHDQRLDYFISEKGLYSFGEGDVNGKTRS